MGNTAVGIGQQTVDRMIQLKVCIRSRLVWCISALMPVIGDLEFMHLYIIRHVTCGDITVALRHKA